MKITLRDIANAFEATLAQRDLDAGLIERLSVKIKKLNAHLAREIRVSRSLDIYMGWEREIPDLEVLAGAQKAIARELALDLLEHGLIRFEMTGKGEYRCLTGFLNVIRPETPDDAD